MAAIITPVDRMIILHDPPIRHRLVRVGLQQVVGAVLHV